MSKLNNDLESNNNKILNDKILNNGNVKKELYNSEIKINENEDYMTNNNNNILENKINYNENISSSL